ncbi:acyl-CoA dehydrogenase family protein [Yinghuangia seranimata]|uniref:acyl-CoA dehydrogenase family protein n=1 Tax=Yinghuangia seranimata TaxID=408067 RepID=UPI00248BD2D6|nr:acyl-CoA dehydrogenase family protein [Yinghuangia seranimata]MDI2124962.1 acyl-CoA dehydrogenase family protein [Yinghuangia seranimata]
MRFALSDEQHELARMASRVAAQRAQAGTGAHVPTWGERPAFDRALWTTLAELGLLGLGVPEERGGSGGGAVELALVAEEMGAAAPLVPYVPAAVALAALTAGDPAGRPDTSELIAEITAGRIVAVPAWETFADLADRPRRDALQVTATEPASHPGDPEVVRVSGTVAVPFGDSADMVVAEAAGRTPGDPRQRVLLDLDRPGVRVTPVEGLDVVEPLAILECEDAVADVVGPDTRPGAAAEAMRVILAAELVGTGRRALDDAVRYAKERHQFGRPIGSFQALKHMLADRHVQLDAARMLVWLAAAEHDTAGATDQGATEVPPGLTALAAATEAADAATADGLQAHGGIGFTWEQPAHVFLKHARARRALLGSPGRRLDRVADALLAL